MRGPKCSVPGCNLQAEYDCILYDVYPCIPEVFFELDFTCPHLCGEHMAHNEEESDGVREPRGSVQYPFTNRHMAQGFTIYRPRV